jgi:hypothetical protein
MHEATVAGLILVAFLLLYGIYKLLERAAKMGPEDDD